MWHLHERWEWLTSWHTSTGWISFRYLEWWSSNARCFEKGVLNHQRIQHSHPMLSDQNVGPIKHQSVSSCFPQNLPRNQFRKVWKRILQTSSWRFWAILLRSMFNGPAVRNLPGAWKHGAGSCQSLARRRSTRPSRGTTYDERMAGRKWYNS